MSERILVVDDERTLRESLAFNLEHRGYSVEVHIGWLRRKIESDPSNPTRFVTVQGAG